MIIVDINISLKKDYFSSLIFKMTCPHSVVTDIVCVTCDQKALGSNPVWIATVWTYTRGA